MNGLLYWCGGDTSQAQTNLDKLKMILINPQGNVRMMLGADNHMWRSERINNRWTKWEKHFGQYNGLMMLNEAKHFLGWRELKPLD